MIDFAEQGVGRAFQRGAVGRHVGRHAGLAEEPAIGLRIKVEAVAAQRQERHARRHFAVARVELLRKGPRPLYSLPSSQSVAQTPWLGVPPSAAATTLAGLAAT